MEINLEELIWLPVQGYPGYEVATTGLICRKKKNGDREILVPYKDPGDKEKKNYVTLWRNFKYSKVWTIEIFRASLIMERIMEEKKRRGLIPDDTQKKTESRKETEKSSPAQYGKSTKNPEMQKQKFKEMVDGYDPSKMSVSAYMRELRSKGYKFTSAHLSSILSEKRKNFIGNGLF